MLGRVAMRGQATRNDDTMFETPEGVADALEEQGAAVELIEQCRTPGTHGLRCWVLEGLR